MHAVHCGAKSSCYKKNKKTENIFFKKKLEKSAFEYINCANVGAQSRPILRNGMHGCMRKYHSLCSGDVPNYIKLSSSATKHHSNIMTYALPHQILHKLQEILKGNVKTYLCAFSTGSLCQLFLRPLRGSVRDKMIVWWGDGVKWSPTMPTVPHTPHPPQILFHKKNDIKKVAHTKNFSQNEWGVTDFQFFDLLGRQPRLMGTRPLLWTPQGY